MFLWRGEGGAELLAGYSNEGLVPPEQELRTKESAEEDEWGMSRSVSAGGSVDVLH